MPKFKKNTSKFRMKSPLRDTASVDLIKKVGLGPRANPNVPQGEDASYEELNDKCMKKGMIYDENTKGCVKRSASRFFGGAIGGLTKNLVDPLKIF